MSIPWSADAVVSTSRSIHPSCSDVSGLHDMTAGVDAACLQIQHSEKTSSMVFGYLPPEQHQKQKQAEQSVMLLEQRPV